MSRRAFFTRWRDVAPPSTLPEPPRVAARPAIPFHRPPGAIEERAFLERCTRCGECATACPHDAIQEVAARFGSAAKTPVIRPVESPCRMCADTPCITACTVGALTKAIPIKMGLARINTMECLAYQRQTCSVCYEQCPVAGAIRLEAGQPVVNADVCTGCGVCAYACPAPRNAIVLMPAAVRPGVEVHHG